MTLRKTEIDLNTISWDPFVAAFFHANEMSSSAIPAARVFRSLVTIAHQQGTPMRAEVSNTMLSAHTGMSQPTIRKYIQLLSLHGYISARLVDDPEHQAFIYDIKYRPKTIAVE